MKGWVAAEQKLAANGSPPPFLRNSSAEALRDIELPIKCSRDPKLSDTLCDLYLYQLRLRRIC